MQVSNNPSVAFSGKTGSVSKNTHEYLQSLSKKSTNAPDTFTTTGSLVNKTVTPLNPKYATALNEQELAALEKAIKDGNLKKAYGISFPQKPILWDGNQEISKLNLNI
ncbi:MAG: hypothetical protein WCF95_01195 [bacterium]